MSMKYTKIFSKIKNLFLFTLTSVSQRSLYIVFVINNQLLLVLNHHNHHQLSMIYLLIELIYKVYQEYIVEYVYLVYEEDILK